MDFDSLSNEELLKRIDNAEFIEKFTNSEDWKLFRDVCKRLSEKASLELENVKANETNRIIELQTICKFYKNVLLSVIESYKKEGMVCFEEAKWYRPHVLMELMKRINNTDFQ